MIVAVATQKGGSAKTTTVVNLGAALAEREERTLIVDLDAQAHATLWLLGPTARQVGPFVQDWLEGRANAEAAVRQTRWPQLEVLPANLALNHLRDRLQAAARPADARVLDDHLRKLAPAYHWVLLDCPAGLSSLTINALVASDGLLIPVAPPDSLAADGTHHMLTTVERIRQGGNPKLRVLGVLLANTQLQRASQRRQVEELERAGLPLLATRVPASARVGTALAAYCPVVTYAPKSAVAAAYRALVVEIRC